MLKSAQLFTNWLPHSMEGYIQFKSIVVNCIYSALIILFCCYIITTNHIYHSDSCIFILYTAITPLILPQEILDPLIGNLLGDGHLRFPNKSKKLLQGPTQFVGNANFCMTLKSIEYITHLWKIYSPISTSVPPRPWPNPKTGKETTQYTINTRSLTVLTELHAQWYIWNELSKFVKIVPLNIADLLTPIGLAHWIMDDGYWSQGSVFLCTDSFTSTEVDLLIYVLQSQFGLLATKQRRIKENKEICWRIRFSQAKGNILNLRSLVQSYFIPTMLYKINL